jgi:hypothetical protein
MKALMYTIGIIAMWFAFLVFAAVIGIAWNVTMVLMQAFDRKFFESIMLHWEPLIGGGFTSLLLLVFLAHIIDTDYL